MAPPEEEKFDIAKQSGIPTPQILGGEKAPGFTTREDLDKALVESADKLKEEFNNTLNERTKKFEEKVALISVDSDNKQDSINKKFDELNRDKISFITVSGIFVAIFTFISIEIQILRYICDFYKIIGFTFIFAGILILFISLLDYVARSWIENAVSNQKRVEIVLIVAIILIAIGLIEVGKSNNDWKCNDSENNSIIQFNPEIKPLDVKVNLPDTIKIQTVK